MEDFNDLYDDIDNLPLDSKRYVSNSFVIISTITKRLSHLGMSQKDLADKMGKTEPEVSKWLSGLHNLTLRTISKLEAALNITIISPSVNIVEEVKIENQVQYFGGHPVVADPSEDYSSMVGLMAGKEIKFEKVSSEYAEEYV